MSRAARTLGPHRIEVDDAGAPPAPSDDEVLLAVEAVGLCGTDLHLYDGSFPGVRYPMVQGHELCGRVEALPDGYEGALAPGRRVVVDPVVACGSCGPCRRGAHNVCASMRAIGVHLPGGLQDHVTVPLTACHPCDDLPPDTAALSEPVSIGLHAIVRTRIEPGERVLVLGCGPIGLASVVAATDVGAEVLAVDLHPQRVERALACGATAAVTGDADVGEVVRGWTGGDGPEVVVEATGVGSVAEQAVALVAPAGRVAIVGVSRDDVTIPMRAFTARELTIVGSRATLDFGAAVQLVRRARSRLEGLVTHRFPLEAAAEAFRFTLEHPDRTLKTMVVPQG